MRLLDKSNKPHADKGPPPQMVDVPIDPPCCVVLTDSRIRNIGATSKYRTQSSVCCHSSFCARHKNILLMTGAISILLIILLLTIANLTFSIMSEHDARNTSAVPVQPEARVKRAIRPGFPRDGRSLLKSRARRTIDGSSSFSDQTRVLTSRITRVAEAAADDVPTINGRHVGAHLIKRELSRKRRDCDLSAKHCENLLQAVQSQLEMLSNKFPATNGGKSLPTDILKCLECAKIIKLNIADESDEDHAASRSRDRYFPYDYVSEPNRSSDYGTTVIKLLDDKAAESGGAKRPTQVNRTEAAKIQAAAADDSVTDGQLRDVTNQSSANTTGVSETSSTVTIDHTNSDESQQTEAAYVNGRADSDNSGVRGDKRPGGNSTVDDSRMIKMQTDGVQSRIDQQQQLRVTIEGKGITSVRPRPSAMMESSTTRYSAITVRDSERFVGTTIAADAMGTIETGTRAIVDFTKQITENVTSLPAGSDVTGIDGAGGGVTVMQQPSVRPSLEGHPENRSDAAAMNGSRSMDHHRAYKQFMQPVDNSLQTKDDVKSSMMPAVSTKSFQQLQLNPTTWSMPHPVCFFGYPGQPAAGVPASLSPASSAAFYPASSSSAAQGRGFSFQNPSSHQASPPLLPNMQVQANTVQFLPGRPNYVGGLAPPTGPGVGPTGPAVSNFPSIFPLNQQQPAVMSQPQQQPVANMPYFCGYMSLPTIRFPPIPGTSQFDRSADEAKDSLLKESQKLPHGGVIVRPDPTLSLQPTFNKCPVNYRQCDNSHCIPRVKWCDGRVDCSDASDETKCSCRDRILRDRLCDGYFDCPHGEDELGCFGCPKDHFSCDDWDRRDNSNNCVSLSQRCDGIMQCPNGKDEVDCNTLLEYIGPNDIFSVGYTQGYLHKNVRGQWYPVCSKSFTWAEDACESEIGRPLTTMPEMQIMRVSEEAYQDLYVIESGTDEIKLTSCPGTAVYVKCPPLPCGTKALPRQTFSNATKYKYMTRRHAEEQSAVELAEFNKLYQQTLGLLNASQSVSGTKVQEQNDTLVGSQSRVVGGRASQPTAWPFLVAIYKNGNFHCGGVILSDVHIISAGHCMDGYQEHYYEIQAGTLRRFSFSPMAQWRRARYVIIHPGYVKRDMQNDFAVIKLDRPLLFNRWVRQVCLPTSNTAGPEWKEGPLPQSMCVAIGWGAVTEDGPEPDHLREVKVPILPSCKHLVDRNEASICAGYPEGGHDACQGDSGGPLMCRNPNLETQWYAAGLISHGDGCGRPDEPGVYMKISYYLDWILQAFETLDNHATYGNQPLDSCPGFSCHSSSGKCLPIQSRCNGVVNCLDAEDEIGCGFLTNNYASYRNSNNTSAKPQTDGVSSDTTEKNMSTEAIPISTSPYFFYQTESQTRDNENTDNSDTVDVYATTPETIMPSVRLTFTCRNLIQTITINKRCDKHLDCEDGTDEEDCTCRDYLSNLQSVAICDGHLDCDDETDEKDCGLCKNTEFYCSRSGGCIPMTRRCDGNFDCPLREDEVDCLTLTDGEYVNMDSDDRPILNTEGLLSRYYNGTWHVECPQADILENGTVTSTIGGNLCKYLGFQSLQSFDKIVVNETELETRRWDSAAGYVLSPEHVVAASEGSGETCTTLRFRCRPVLSSSADSHLVVDPRTGNHTYLWPWLAAIFVDGRYHCSALLLEPDWLLASSSCTAAIRLSVNYTTALLGQSRSFLYVDGPHQQVSVVDEIRDVKLSDVSLLHLKTAVNFTRYVQPLFLEKRIYPPAKDDLCVAIGTNDEHVTQSIFLQPILQNCDKCYRCFVEALGSFSIKCPVNGTSSNWSGTVFCRGEKGWYPAAVFQENGGLCGFRTVRNLTSIDYIHAYLTQALEEAPQSTPEVTCDGVRCNIGQCIPKNQVCDGVVDCRDGADEESEMCLQMQQIRRTNGSNDKCARSELRCRNGECVTKSAFCDGKVDCSDGTDEPTVCSCAEYLRLTAPERLCDGVRHCLDKTDESLKACQCTETSFKCNTGSRNITCISQDFVCDGDSDCPNGEDETKCRKVQETADGRFAAGEVIQRSYGVWHTLCYPSVIKSNEEAANVCRSSGYTGGIIDYEYQLANEFVVPTRDDFYMVRLNPGTWITMRDDKPLVTLIQPEKPCYRLVVKCK
ncbi:PREDICTED: serine protease nudel isoform X2 [Wasmannia auropunctata]|uniref:serine protease nudel isoform X2 n=1 Tax=Wasmannia auropunctata TaxID=64793 RepID=UPI0005EEED0B|nr:PREDICTED: serine protease nudel isoform X2 [Wasmannia auropunctata]